MNYKIEDLHRVSEGKAFITFPGLISHVSIDSRTISSFKDTLFVALKGEKTDGHMFVDQLYQSGCRNFLLHRSFQNVHKYKQANVILVNDTLEAFQKIAAYHRSRFKIPVIGITGSNGKTIVKEWLGEFLKSTFSVLKSPKSYNSQIGVPLSVLLLDSNHSIGIFEAGISKPGEMQTLEPVIKPDIGVVTNIGSAHQENFENIEQKIDEKLNLFVHSKSIIFSKDQEDVCRRINANPKLALKKHFAWSYIDQDADLFISNVHCIHRVKTEITGVYRRKTYKIEIPFEDKASIENAIVVWAILLVLGLDGQFFLESFKSLSGVSMRMEQKEGVNQCILINDSYSSDLESLSIALTYLSQFNQKMKKTIIVSDILQSGLPSEELYHRLADMVHQNNVTKVVAIGTEIQKFSSLFYADFYSFETTNDFLNSNFIKTFYHEVILLKAARNFHFEKIFNALGKKIHQTRMEINLSSLVKNYNYFKNLLLPETKIMVMVKAFSYGTGAFEIANILQYHHVDYLAVAYTSEGVELREAGISVPIMVMNPDLESYDLMISFQLEPEIYSMNSLKAFYNVAKREGIKAYPIHIKLDTGMNRLGFKNEDLTSLVSFLKSNEHLHVKSVFSHLSSADLPSEDEFSKSQIVCFVKQTDELEKGLQYRFIRHILNSAGIQRFLSDQFEMVRLGIGLYGISADDQQELQNVSSLKTIVSQLKLVKKGESVSYSRSYIAEKDALIATLPIGYADGLNRLLSNKNGQVVVKGKRAPIVGNICMDMCMIDVTGMEVEEGDEVELYGEEISVKEIASKINTIPYEVFTSISHRVKRVYLQE